jgi:hypothetical protein
MLESQKDSLSYKEETYIYTYMHVQVDKRMQKLRS